MSDEQAIPATAAIALRSPYDFEPSIAFWRLSTGELCEQWADGVYRRVVDLHGAPVVLTLRNMGTLDAPVVTLDVNGRAATPDERAVLEPTARFLLGDDLDLEAFYAVVADDPVFASVTQGFHGLHAVRSPLWETLCYVIAGQQISVGFAYTLKRRLVERYGERFEVGGRALYRFPTPEVLAAADVNELLAMQYSRNKASFIIGLAQQIIAHTLDLQRVVSLPTAEAVAYLSGFRGVGRWTAEFTLLRALGRRDALPANDAGVRQGITLLYGEKLPEPQLRAFAERWGEWGGIAALYLLAVVRATREQATTHRKDAKDAKDF